MNLAKLQSKAISMELTYFGHACFGVKLGGKDILFDPFITYNPLPAAKKINIENIKADYILVSHGHEDHVADVDAIAKRTNAKIVANYEIVNWFAKKGFENNHPMNIGGNWTFDFGKVKMVNAIHSSVMPDGSSGGNPGGFVVESNEASFYFTKSAANIASSIPMVKLSPIGSMAKSSLCCSPNNFISMVRAVSPAK